MNYEADVKKSIYLLNGHRIIYLQADTVNADSIAEFLSRLRKHHPGKAKIHIIWDNAGYHSDAAIQEFARNLAIPLCQQRCRLN